MAAIVEQLVIDELHPPYLRCHESYPHVMPQDMLGEGKHLGQQRGTESHAATYKAVLVEVLPKANVWWSERVIVHVRHVVVLVHDECIMHHEFRILQCLHHHLHLVLRPNVVLIGEEDNVPLGMSQRVLEVGDYTVAAEVSYKLYSTPPSELTTSTVSSVLPSSETTISSSSPN